MQRERVQKYFNQRAADGSYAALYKGGPPTRENWSYRARRDKALALVADLRPRLPQTPKVLDVGCAGGELAEDLVGLGFHYTGLDRSPIMLERARQRHPQLQFVQGEAAHLPFPDASFDLVNALGLIEYLDDPHTFLNEAQRVLRGDGGCLLLSVSTRYCWENWLKGLLWLPRRVLGFFYFRVTGKQRYPIRHQMRSARSLRRLLHSHGFVLRTTVYYNPDPFCFPLSRCFPRLSLRASMALESRARRFPWRWTCTGVLVPAYTHRGDKKAD